NEAQAGRKERTDRERAQRGTKVPEIGQPYPKDQGSDSGQRRDRRGKQRPDRLPDRYQQKTPRTLAPDVPRCERYGQDIHELKVICYLDREPRDEDYEHLGEVTGEVCADINFKEVEQYCVYSVQLFIQLNSVISWVCKRNEE